MKGRLIMNITSTELKTNLGKYLDLVTTQDIVITRNGRKVAKLVKEEDDVLSDVRSLYGLLADSDLSGMNDTDIKSVIHEERSKRYGSSD
jgi:prevent-host-death family protein